MAKFKYSIELESLRDRPLADSLAKENEYRKELKAEGKIHYDNDLVLCLNPNEWDEFDLMLVENNPREGSVNATRFGPHYWEIIIWAENGQMTIGHWTTVSDSIPESLYRNIKMHLDKYSDGFVRCSQCGEWIKAPKKQWVRRYYAGVYCQKCWDGGVAAQAAADNYD